MVRCLSCDKLVLAGRMRRNNARKKKIVCEGDMQVKASVV